MKIEFVTIPQNEPFQYKVGQVVEVQDSVAADYVRVGWAKPAVEPQAQTPNPSPEQPKAASGSTTVKATAAAGGEAESPVKEVAADKAVHEGQATRKSR